jgi:O-antigen/teichoic acid export membrane protein
MERYGREGPAALAPHIKDYMRSLSLIAAPATAAVGLFGLPVLVHGFLPDFDAGLPAMKVALLTLLVSQPSLLFLQLLLADKRVGRLMTLTAVALAVEVGVLATGSLDGLTIEWAAWAAVAGQATFALLALGAMIRQLQLPRDEVTSFWGRLPIAWGAFLGIALGVDALVPDADGLLASVGTAAGQFALFVVASAAVVALVDRDALSASRALLRRGT